MSDQVSTSPHHQFIIVAVALGTILNPLNTTMITVALPAIQDEFLLTSKDISWLIASYFIVSAIFLPLIGKLSDSYGRKKIFIAGLGLVGISSFLAPLSPNMLFLLGMRTIQAIGTSALFPAGIGIVRTNIEKNQNRVIATLAVFATTSAAFGPTISGLLIQYGGWPIIFYVNFPVILLSALLACMYIPNDVPGRGNVPFKWDGFGILLFSLFLSCWMLFFLSLEEGFNPWTFILSTVLTFLFYSYEKKRTDPFISVIFLKTHLNITLIYVQYILSTLIFFALLLFIPTYLQSVVLLDSQLSGIMMLSISVFGIIMTPIATRWTERSGYRVPLLFGAVLEILGVVLLFTTAKSSPLFWLFIVFSIIGLSAGVLSISLQNLLYSFVARAQSGMASGLLMTSRFIGNILASSLYGVMFASGMNEESKFSMTVVLLIVAIILIPGMFYVTRQRSSMLMTNEGRGDRA